MDKSPQDACRLPGKAAGRPKAAEVEARTQELLQTAGGLFLKNGYTKTSLESIARAAHVAVRTIYVKFGGKAGLLHAVLAAKRDRFFRSQPMETDPRPLQEIVRRVRAPDVRADHLAGSDGHAAHRDGRGPDQSGTGGSLLERRSAPDPRDAGALLRAPGHPRPAAPRRRRSTCCPAT